MRRQLRYLLTVSAPPTAERIALHLAGTRGVLHGGCVAAPGQRERDSLRARSPAVRGREDGGVLPRPDGAQGLGQGCEAQEPHAHFVRHAPDGVAQGGHAVHRVPEGVRHSAMGEQYRGGMEGTQGLRLSPKH